MPMSIIGLIFFDPGQCTTSTEDGATVGTRNPTREPQSRHPLTCDASETSGFQAPDPEIPVVGGRLVQLEGRRARVQEGQPCSPGAVLRCSKSPGVAGNNVAPGGIAHLPELGPAPPRKACRLARIRVWNWYFTVMEFVQ